MIHVIDNSDEQKFTELVNSYLEAGGVLKSCSSGVVDSAAYDYCSWFHAIVEMPSVTEGIDIVNAADKLLQFARTYTVVSNFDSSPEVRIMRLLIDDFHKRNK